jgi:hypothetical protein
MRIQESLSLLCLFLMTGTTVVYPFQPVGNAIRLTKTSTTSLTAQLQSNENSSTGRRAFVTGGVMAAASVLSFPQYATADGSSSLDYKAVAKDIIDIVQKNPDWGPSKF